MITQKTAGRIWDCYREIAAGEKLIADMQEATAEANRRAEKFRGLEDVFGRRRQLTLGVPSGEDSHRILDVAPELALSVIRAHMANKQAELVQANEEARMELDSKNPEKKKVAKL